MIHINSKKGSSILSRRPRGYVHTVIILLLLVCLTYILYMNTALKEQVQVLDVLNKRYEERHQRLSSDLQETYGRKGELENSLIKAKNEHKKVNSELEQQKQEHLQMVEEYQGKVNELEEKHADLLTRLNHSQEMLTRVTEEKESIAAANYQQSRVIEYHKNQTKVLQEDNSKLQEDFRKLSEKKGNRETDENIQRMKIQAKDFDSLKEVLRKAGADVLNLDHKRFNEMSSDERLLLFTHLTDSSDVAKQLEEKRLLLHKNKNTVVTSNPDKTEAVDTGHYKNKNEDKFAENNMEDAGKNEPTQEIKKKDNDLTQKEDEKDEVTSQQGSEENSDTSKETKMNVTPNVDVIGHDKDKSLVSQDNDTLSELRKVHEKELAVAEMKTNDIKKLMKITDNTAEDFSDEIFSDSQFDKDGAFTDNNVTVPDSDETVSEPDALTDRNANTPKDANQDSTEGDIGIDHGYLDDDDIADKEHRGEHGRSKDVEEEIIDVDADKNEQINT